MKCSSKDCQADAVCGAAVRVPALNCPVAEHEPLKAALGLRFCEVHFAELKLEDFVNEEFRKLVRGTLQHQGKAPPDFDRAWLERLELDSPDMKALEDLAKRKMKMSDEEFNGLLAGPLHHPLPMFTITRLAMALRYVVERTGAAGVVALRLHCDMRNEKDEREE